MIKALTIQQPYAWAIMQSGGKNVENRSQAWKHRGPIAIHAGLQWSPRGFIEVARILDAAFRADFVTGAILGVVDLADVHTGWEGCCPPWGQRGARAHLVLENPRPLPEPIPCRGRLGLWTPPEPVLARLREFVGGGS